LIKIKHALMLFEVYTNVTEILYATHVPFLMSFSFYIDQTST